MDPEETPLDSMLLEELIEIDGGPTPSSGEPAPDNELNEDSTTMASAEESANLREELNTTDPRQYHLTDLGNARRFANQHGGCKLKAIDA